MRNLLFFLPSKEEKKQIEQKTTEIQLSTLPTGTTIVLLYHQEDRDLMADLSPHLNVLALRLKGLFEWKYYSYRVSASQEENQHEEFVRQLGEEAFLFLPCTSGQFCQRFLEACQKDPRIPVALTQLYVQPLPLRIAQGVSPSILPQPLAAYASGHPREEACVQIVEELERKLLAYHRSNFPQQETPKVPLILPETAKALVSR